MNNGKDIQNLIYIDKQTLILLLRKADIQLLHKHYFLVISAKNNSKPDEKWQRYAKFHR